jgi:hypothetical protein
MKRILELARRFRLDNNLTNFGSELYQPNLPINCVVDCWGIPAAMIRGLFEYLYRADGLTILPHIPTGIVRLAQDFPIRFGMKQLYLATAGQGPITSVTVNGQPWPYFDARSVSLPYGQTPDEAVIQIVLGGAKSEPFVPRKHDPLALTPPPATDRLPKSPLSESVVTLSARAAALRVFHQRLVDAGLGDSYEAAHTRLITACLATAAERVKRVAEGKFPALAPDSQKAADASYVEATARLRDGLEKAVLSYATSDDSQKQEIHRLWIGQDGVKQGKQPRDAGHR